MGDMALEFVSEAADNLERTTKRTTENNKEPCCLFKMKTFMVTEAFSGLSLVSAKWY